MKKVLFILFIFISCLSYGQKNLQKEDTTTICFPVNVGKQILLDLNELDRLKKQSLMDQKEINQLELKVEKKDNIIGVLELKDKNNEIIIKNTEEKVKLLDEENKELRKDIRKIKTKNTVIEIVSGSIVAALTYVLVFK